jgi:hypothetical protein
MKIIDIRNKSTNNLRKWLERHAAGIQNACVRREKIMLGNRGGMLSIFGGAGSSKRRPLFLDARFLVYTYASTREAIQEVLPPPLAAGPRPIVSIVVADFPRWFALDEENHPYREAFAIVECEYQGTVGTVCPFIYVGPRGDDFTEGADMAMCLGREGTGYPKKLAYISIENNGNEWHATVTRRGKRLIDLRATFDGANSNEPTLVMNGGPQFCVKEVLSGDYQGGLDLHQVWTTLPGWDTTSRDLQHGSGTLRLDRIVGDALDTLVVVQPGKAQMFVNDIWAPPPTELVADLVR